MRGLLRVLCLLLLISVGGLSQAADRITPLDADALAADLAERKGRVVLLNFWATWCRPCLEEIPALQELEVGLGPQGFDLVAVSLDQYIDLEVVVRPFMEKWFPDFSSYISVEDEMDAIVSVVDPYWNEVLPTTYIIGRDGAVAERIQGGSTAEEFAAAVHPHL